MVHQSILGAQGFVDGVRQKLPRERQREIPSLKKLQHDISVERIIGVVAEAGNAKSEELRDRKTKHKDLTRLAMELSLSIRKYDDVFTHSGLSAACDELSRDE